MSPWRRIAVLAALILIILAAPAQAAPPTVVVALGDGFVSSEGAGAYRPVTDANGQEQTFPGWSAPNGNGLFCHRSANASLPKATLPGIQDRFNLAPLGRPAALTVRSCSERSCCRPRR